MMLLEGNSDRQKLKWCYGLEKPDRNLLTLKFLSHEKVKKNIYS